MQTLEASGFGFAVTTSGSATPGPATALPAEFQIDFLRVYSLSTKEGLALMVLAEALLRVPDPHTADALIDDKLGSIDWGEHLGTSGSTFVNAATISLIIPCSPMLRPSSGEKMRETP